MIGYCGEIYYPNVFKLWTNDIYLHVELLTISCLVSENLDLDIY